MESKPAMNCDNAGQLDNPTVKRVLAVYYSQTGQSARILDAVIAPLRDEAAIRLDELVIEPNTPFPFPWPFWTFFSIFPECIYLDYSDIKPVALPADNRYDLVILAYQVWFLAPSLPMTAFLKTPWAKKVLKDTPVMTLIGCRNMWLNAQETVKNILKGYGARLVDNAVLTDEAGTAASFLSTPLWLLTGKKQPVSWIPAAGVAEAKIIQARRFGRAIISRLKQSGPIESPMLRGLKAVNVNGNIIASERIGNRSFMIWGRLLRLLGPVDSLRRRMGLLVYILFLAAMICTVVPLNFLINKCLYPLRKQNLARQKHYYSQPSGE
jgi:hypothetical protein